MTTIPQTGDDDDALDAQLRRRLRQVLDGPAKGRGFVACRHEAAPLLRRLHTDLRLGLLPPTRSLTLTDLGG